MNLEELKLKIDKLKGVKKLEKTIESDIIKALEEDDLMKSWSTDLQKKHPGGKWVTIRGAKIFVDSGGKIVAGNEDLRKKLDISKVKKEIHEKIKKEEALGKPMYDTDDYYNEKSWVKYIKNADKKDIGFADFKRALQSKKEGDTFSYYFDGKKIDEHIGADLNNTGIRQVYNEWQEGKKELFKKDNSKQQPTNNKKEEKKRKIDKPENMFFIEKTTGTNKYKVGDGIKGFDLGYTEFEKIYHSEDKHKMIDDLDVSLEEANKYSNMATQEQRLYHTILDKTQNSKQSEKKESGKDLSMSKEEYKKFGTKSYEKKGVDGLDQFRDIARKAKDVEDFMNKVREIKDVPSEVSKQFMDKYGDGGKKTSREASVRFMKENTDIAKQPEKREKSTEDQKKYFQENRKEIMEIIDDDPLMSIGDAIKEHKESRGDSEGDYNKKVDDYFSAKKKEYENNNKNKLYASKGNVSFNDLTEDMKKVAYKNAIDSGDMKSTFEDFKKYFKNEEISLDLVKNKKVKKSMELDIIKALGFEEEVETYNKHQEAIIKGFELGIYNENDLEKAIGHKYFKKEPKAGGGYKYYYTEAQYKKEKQGGGEKKESYADSDEYRVKRGEYGSAREKGASHEESQKIAEKHWEKVKNEYSSKKDTSGEKKEEGKSGKRSIRELSGLKPHEMSFNEYLRLRGSKGEYHGTYTERDNMKRLYDELVSKSKK